MDTEKLQKEKFFNVSTSILHFFNLLNIYHNYYIIIETIKSTLEAFSFASHWT